MWWLVVSFVLLVWLLICLGLVVVIVVLSASRLGGCFVGYSVVFARLIGCWDWLAVNSVVYVTSWFGF